MGAMSDWRSFWDSAHSIYVNARHKDVHYREIADQIAGFVPGPGARVLDYGCGEAIHADRVAGSYAKSSVSNRQSGNDCGERGLNIINGAIIAIESSTHSACTASILNEFTRFR